MAHTEAELLENPVFFGLQVVRDYPADVLADHLGLGVPENPFRSGVPAHYVAGKVLADDRIVRRLDDRGKMACGQQQRVPDVTRPG